MPPTNDTLIALAAAVLFVSAQVQADATIVYKKGDVRDDRALVALDQRIASGTTLITGTGAQAHLVFSDQQQVVLEQNTAFRIADFHYVANEPQAGRATFELLRGSMRFVSGTAGSRNPGVVALRIPQATLSPRGTDFMVALVNPAYVKVLQGAVGVTNAGGTVVFGANTAARVVSASAIAQPVFVAALPPGVASSFSILAAAPARTIMAQAPGPAAAPSGPASAASSGAARPSAARIGRSVLVGTWAAALVGALASESSSTHH